MMDAAAIKAKADAKDFDIRRRSRCSLAKIGLTREHAAMPRRERKQTVDAIDGRIGGNLRTLRMVAGLSMEQLAARLAISTQQVGKYERGVDRVAAATLFRAAAVLGVRVGRLYAGLHAARVTGFGEGGSEFDREGAPTPRPSGLFAKLAAAPLARRRAVIRTALADLAARED